MTASTAPIPRFCYGEYLEWHDGERWELIDGEALWMGPAPTRLHQIVLQALFRQIADHLDDKPCEVYVAPFDVRLPRGYEADRDIRDVVQPDLSIFCDPEKLDDRGARGAPDWIVEILSPSSKALDRTRKRGLYARHGVREYWIVDPQARSVTMCRRPAEEDYGECAEAPARGRTGVEVFPGFGIDWRRVFKD